MSTHAQVPDDVDYEQIRDELFIPYRPSRATPDDAKTYMVKQTVDKAIQLEVDGRV